MQVPDCVIKEAGRQKSSERTRTGKSGSCEGEKVRYVGVEYKEDAMHDRPAYARLAISATRI